MPDCQSFVNSLMRGEENPELLRHKIERYEINGIFQWIREIAMREPSQHVKVGAVHMPPINFYNNGDTRLKSAGLNLKYLVVIGNCHIDANWKNVYLKQAYISGDLIVEGDLHIEDGLEAENIYCTGSIHLHGVWRPELVLKANEIRMRGKLNYVEIDNRIKIDCPSITENTPKWKNELG